ncbi:MULTISPECIES: fibrillarin-like rRNA/tRNA 2'-O-methyltransferase [Thermococcus]|uniref:Fibrillarin-like rRNA/tRNA 2'-O-methyltransferase n=2 Tax=Thermococcus sibiricus TaxID=172049 RepID=FLPA_THESM|nr:MULTISPECIES: fibrillarin-like rRNA/tRNA 2'-O-methyltransferase [Thermococcus]C6A2L3.1 RecName: Full=Fibrillarin-like rRNA/tRNA 2'-O-methyltransferase [Thermococcus sibiricus MM 739]KUK28083.1 MAG: Fibrillarin-like rRNA/tRNA 2'-O-methyltransferase [Thermococcus sp. 40_45]HII67733.1 fibrillarin-like rRNA/tRNA 2'-O-methyltransferase [Thermococcaceae archaeon]ACS89858.1 Fibrillarin-like rRNA/tRNA 2'-O-methyltransferase [Thermococcus sibiricus MM 739]KUK18235.1 MAG: Fibrillarin-like rRNA/tRNA 2
MNVKKHKFPGVYTVIEDDGSERIATKNLVPGQKVYGERIVKWKGEEYRIWNPNRSKLAAAILNDLKNFPIKPGTTVLYLGIASGTTASHVSDIIGWEGKIFGIEFSPRVLRELVPLVEERRNIVPILGDATKPEEYRALVTKVDVIFEDVAQPTQAKILIDNAKAYLKSGGYGMISIKSRSIDVTKEPEEVFREVEKELSEYFEVVERISLEPYEKDHALIVVRKP